MALPQPNPVLDKGIATLVDLLRFRAEENLFERAYVFLEDGEKDEKIMSYADLDRRARAIAAQLQELGVMPGDRAVLLYPPGLEYVAGFFGCLYAGVIAVPAYPPNPMRLDRTLPRLQAIVGNAGASIALTTEPILQMAPFVFAQAPDLAAMQWLATDTIEDENAAGWRRPDVSADSLAFLQYTSGSTQTPRGVMLSHANLLHNLELIRQAFELVTAEDIGIIWLPPYHDMGLIGGLLEPIYNLMRVVLISPIAFLQRPVRWVQAISKYHATVSGGPNFAYDLVARKITPSNWPTWISAPGPWPSMARSRCVPPPWIASSRSLARSVSNAKRFIPPMAWPRPPSLPRADVGRSRPSFANSPSIFFPAKPAIMATASHWWAAGCRWGIKKR